MSIAPKKPRAGRGRGRSVPLWQAGVAVLLVVAVAGWGLYDRISADATLAQKSEDHLVPVVQSVAAANGPADEEVVLPGTVQPLIEAPIYARTNGYVRVWYTDIGTKVSKGQVLAELETPEVDQQLRQAQADLATAQANQALAQSSAKRWHALMLTDSVSQQENDEKQADAAAKSALLASAQANVARLQEMEGFKRVVAPFDGVVTARQTDIGALINSGAGNGSPLFRVADIDRLRIYSQVPEAYARAIAPGIKVQLSIVSTNRVTQAQVVRTADALDSVSRSLLVEIQADNSRHDILPGGYAEVHFRLPLSSGRPRIPVAALIFRADGLQVAKLDGNNHVHMTGIKLGRDFGTQVEVADGLAAGDQILIGPPDSLNDGDLVRLADKTEPAAKGTQ